MKEKTSITFRDIIEFCFLPVLSAGVIVLWDLNKNVGTLNLNVGVLIERSNTFDKAITEVKQENKELRERVLKIEQQRGR